MTKTIEDLFFYAVFAADLIVILQIIFFFKITALNKVLWSILLYCLLNSTVNILSSNINSISSHYILLVLFTSLEYLLFSTIFYYSIKSNKFKKLIIVFSFLFLILITINFLYGKHKNYDSLSIGVETILVMVYCFYYLYEQMNDLSTSFIYHRYHFWIAIGILIYLGGSFFIYIFADKVDNSILDDYWFLTYAFYIVKNIFFLIGIGHLISQSKQSTLSRVKPYTN